MQEKNPSTEDVLGVISGVIVPLAQIERTMVMPPDYERHENVLEHSYMLGMVACALASRLDSELDLGLVAQYALVHDVVEVHAGDTSVWASQEQLSLKSQREHSSLLRISEEQASFPWIARTIEEYETRETRESCYVYALDKMLTHMFMLVADRHPVRPTRAAYLRTEQTARDKIAKYPLLLPYFEDLCREFTKRQHFFAD